MKFAFSMGKNRMTHSGRKPGYLNTTSKGPDNSALPVFFDMDGTLAEWNAAAQLDEVMAPGYFQKVKPVPNMINAVKKLMQYGHPVYITSKVFSHTTAAEDKNIWLDRYLPAIPETDRFFIPYEYADKNAIPLPGGVLPYYILVDDSTHHGLSGWNGVGIKVDNGINNTNRSWSGYIVSVQSQPDIIANTIHAISRLSFYSAGANQKPEKSSFITR